MNASTRSHGPPLVVTRAVDFVSERPAGESDGRTLQGYASVFNSPAVIDSWEGRFTEVVQRGAFAATIRGPIPIMQYNHGTDPRVGTVPIASVQLLREDEHGLFVQARMYSNDAVEPIREAIAGHSIRGMSIKFRIRSESWTDAEGRSVRAHEVGDRLCRGDELTRLIHSVDLIELGPVLHPVFEATSVGLRSARTGLSPGERASYMRKLELQRLLAA
ncbi:HK97 family phage prohead protease [Streptomyces collinus]|uniref:HK97 family phage prohead protease n=1 Tax=Streptomyces collinus TaxID=42684 RepID=UPI003409E608